MRLRCKERETFKLLLRQTLSYQATSAGTSVFILSFPRSWRPRPPQGILPELTIPQAEYSFAHRLYVQS